MNKDKFTIPELSIDSYARKMGLFLWRSFLQKKTELLSTQFAKNFTFDDGEQNLEHYCCIG